MTRFLSRGARLLALGMFIAGGAQGEDGTMADARLEPLPGHEIFRVPGLAGGLRQFREFLEHGHLEAADDSLEQLIAAFPDSDLLRAGRTELSDGKTASPALEAVAAFAAPMRAACPTAAGPAGQEVVARGNAEAAVVSQNRAPVTAGNTSWVPPVQRLVSEFAFPPILWRKPISPGGGEPARGKLPAPELRQLQRWFAQGKAAGLAGVIYDNRDRGHSRLSPPAWPQLGFTQYSAAARAAALDHGLNTDILFRAVTFGNSSTAVTGGPLWRSQARLALTVPEGPERLFQLYAHDHLYVFPEHRDHDPAQTGGQGDLFPANTPYYLVSQGSSGSDRPFLVAVAAILAAMTPDVREFLDRHDLIAPTVQMVFRSGLKGVGGPEDYMSPQAHPSAFRAGTVDLARMIRIAQALEAAALPPMPCVRVERQTHPIPRVGYFGDGLSEILFDTPSAIARVWRGADSQRRFRVSASETRDPNGRTLTFHWRLLRGDPERVRIERLDEAGAEVEISLGWHERSEIAAQRGLGSDRIDIAVFADNGATLSAPAFLSMLFPAGERREYETLPDGTRRILAIDYADHDRRNRYTDPALFPRRDWRDSYAYDEEGRLLGWTRVRKGRAPESFTRHGLRVVTRDALGRPALAEEIAYPVSQGKQGMSEVGPTATGQVFGYAYAGEQDLLGVPVRDLRAD